MDEIRRIVWCSKQAKGIKLAQPNNNLCDAYLKKANTALKSMNLNIEAKLYEWAVEAAYYARYHSIYALLQKCGIKSEIHDCSILAIKFLFTDKFDQDFLEDIEKAKKHRIDMTYYTDRLVPEKDFIQIGWFQRRT